VTDDLETPVEKLMSRKESAASTVAGVPGANRGGTVFEITP